MYKVNENLQSCIWCFMERRQPAGNLQDGEPGLMVLIQVRGGMIKICKECGHITPPFRELHQKLEPPLEPYDLA